MVIEKVLTNEEIITIGHQARAIETGEKGYILPIAFARAIEQAVLQSTEIQALRKDAELWEPIISEIHRRAGKEHAMEDRCDFTVTIDYEDYAAIVTALEQQT